MLKLRSKPHVPTFIGRPPKPPGPKPVHLTAVWKQQARRFARYILILLRPWKENDGQHPGVLTWSEMCRFVRKLRDGSTGKGQTFLGRITLTMLENIAQGLRTNNNELAAAQDYRCRESSVLNKPDVTSALPKRVDGWFDDEELISVEANLTTKRAKKNKRHQTKHSLSFVVCKVRPAWMTLLTHQRSHN